MPKMVQAVHVNIDNKCMAPTAVTLDLSHTVLSTLPARNCTPRDGDVRAKTATKLDTRSQR